MELRHTPGALGDQEGSQEETSREPREAVIDEFSTVPMIPSSPSNVVDFEFDFVFNFGTSLINTIDPL